MLLQEEPYVVNWLAQYGALPRAQVVRMLQKPAGTAEKILKSLLRLLQPQEDLKYIVVLPHISMAGCLRLPKVPCLFATVDFQGGEEPEILFYSEEKVHEGILGSA